MIDTLSDAHLADFAAIEPIYVDGIAGVFNLGPNFATLYLPVDSRQKRRRHHRI